ncbi:hypothetical protein F4780DRAFT_59838 [Xylariomycetidae sp. FL0641]|nr:hypothetical protein F4780DRAFT_59838 [Xylariomycetidae sp. FL0641]
MASFAELAASLPPCAVACLTGALMNSTCPITDPRCACGSEAVNTQGRSCVVAACSVRESLETTNATNRFCGVEPAVDHSFVAVLAAFIALTSLVVAMRLLARVFTNMTLWWDDWANFGAMLTCIAYTGLLIGLKNGGYGTDIWAVPPDNLNGQLSVRRQHPRTELALTFNLVKGFYVAMVLYVLARLLVRVSIILFYRRVFRASQAERLIWITLHSSVILSLPFNFVVMFQCRPISYFWLQWDGEHTGWCIDQRAFFWTGWVLLLLNDLWILGIPLVLIAKLQQTMRKKILVYIMFCTGVLVVIISAYKLSLIDKFTSRANPTYDYVEMGTWAGVEIDLGVICACMPSLPVLFRPMVERLKLVTAGGTASSQYFRSPSHVTAEQRSRVVSFPPKMEPILAPTPSHYEEGHRIKIVTTIQQTNHLSEAGTYYPLAGEPGIEMNNMNQRNWRAEAWS